MVAHSQQSSTVPALLVRDVLLSEEMCGVSSKMPENGRRGGTSSAYPLKTVIGPVCRVGTSNFATVIVVAINVTRSYPER